MVVRPHDVAQVGVDERVPVRRVHERRVQEALVREEAPLLGLGLEWLGLG